MKRPILAALALVPLASPALAHLDPGEHGAFMAGLSHPIFGLDHVLAMIAVGLWAAALGGRARWRLPTAFVAAMVAGFLTAVAGVDLPWVEPVVSTSVLLLGLAVALAFRLPVGTAALLTAVFGFFHGHAHGGELGGAGALEFGLGFVAATFLLHIAGLLIAWGYGRNARLVRGLGWATVLGWAWLVASA